MHILRSSWIINSWKKQLLHISRHKIRNEKRQIFVDHRFKWMAALRQIFTFVSKTFSLWTVVIVVLFHCLLKTGMDFIFWLCRLDVNKRSVFPSLVDNSFKHLRTQAPGYYVINNRIYAAFQSRLENFYNNFNNELYQAYFHVDYLSITDLHSLCIPPPFVTVTYHDTTPRYSFYTFYFANTI